ncbi:CHRD domain-containing protein [Argonema antarcticum A004/B2]|nr:CHRD domain-containing protein [Argonema antarcticum A004/B2]
MANIFKTSMTGDQEPMPTGSKAIAFAGLELNDTGDALTYSITVKGLDFGPVLGLAPQTPDSKDDVTSLHFHSAPRGTDGPVVFGIVNPAQDTDDRAIAINPDGSATVTGIWEQTDIANQPLSTFVAPLKATNPGADTVLYLNIHTNAFPKGEIRGQVAATSGTLIQGTDGNDNLRGGVGDDTLFGKQGNDSLVGSDGDDLFNGNQGSDTLNGGLGKDSLYGGQDKDFLFGNEGADVLFGNLGDDSLAGGKGDDIFNGNQGSDTIDGNVGNDIIYGGQDNDLLIGSTGSDFLSGDKGNDTLSGVDASAASPGLGEIDTLVGGEGSDRFILANTNVFYYNDGNDADAGLNDYALITDFKAGEDVIQLRGSANNYVLAISKGSLPTGTAIFQVSAQNELVGIVQGVTDLSLGSSSFTFV